MCGIVGIVGKTEVAEPILEALRRLEYRGYDSAGIATIAGGSIERRRAEGKLRNLEQSLSAKPLPGNIGIGHTRWATHGAPNETNAHPHATDKVAVVHNGIIENYQELRAELTAKGYSFQTDTDTEVIPVLITRLLDAGKSPVDAAAAAFDMLEGAYAVAIIFKGQENLMVAARCGSPLAVGYGDGEMYIGSDAIALAPLTSRVAYLEEGDWVVLTRDAAEFHDREGHKVSREIRVSSVSSAAIGKDGYRHFMLKEIYEQPSVIGETINAYIDAAHHEIAMPEGGIDFAGVSQINIIACGTSYYAGMVAGYWLEKIARVPAFVHIASEFRYREPVLPKGGVCLFISQSGETADTLAALRLAKSMEQKVISIVNSPESTMANESDLMLRTYAGPEIGVASTKAFTTQLAVLAMLAIRIGKVRDALDSAAAGKLLHSLMEIPGKAADFLAMDDGITPICSRLSKARDVIYLGRGESFPIALEGALKLKEISYIHAEGYAAGEMKHGPIALIDENVPVIVVAPQDGIFDKTFSNIQEARARGGRILLISDAEGLKRAAGVYEESIEMPPCDSIFAPILYALPVQLLAYHVAVMKGTDVDQPRNLAKSVTVE